MNEDSMRSMEGYMNFMRGDISGQWEKALKQGDVHEAAHLFLADTEEKMQLSTPEGLMMDREGEPTPLGHLWLATVCMFMKAFEAVYVDGGRNLDGQEMHMFVMAQVLAGVRIGVAFENNGMSDWSQAFIPEELKGWMVGDEDTETE